MNLKDKILKRIKEIQEKGLYMSHEEILKEKKKLIDFLHENHKNLTLEDAMEIQQTLSEEVLSRMRKMGFNEDMIKKIERGLESNISPVEFKALLEEMGANSIGVPGSSSDMKTEDDDYHPVIKEIENMMEATIQEVFVDETGGSNELGELGEDVMGLVEIYKKDLSRKDFSKLLSILSRLDKKVKSIVNGLNPINDFDVKIDLGGGQGAIASIKTADEEDYNKGNIPEGFWGGPFLLDDE